MIKLDELQETRKKAMYKNGGSVSLTALENNILTVAQNYGIPLASKNDQVKSGGLLSKTIEDCVVFYHPQHERDYYNFCIRIQMQGTNAFVCVNHFGESKNLKKLAMRENAKQNAKVAGKSVLNHSSDAFAGVNDAAFGFGKLMKGAAGGLLSIGGSKAKQEEENNYYAALNGIFDEVIS